MARRTRPIFGWLIASALMGDVFTTDDEGELDPEQQKTLRADLEDLRELRLKARRRRASSQEESRREPSQADSRNHAPGREGPEPQRA